MKPPPFAYHDPRSFEEALQLVAQYGAEGKILAGGQSLMPMLNSRLLAPSALIDINHIGELDYIREVDGELRLGALTRQRRIERAAPVRSRLPLLAEATQLIAHLPIRSRGTIGGSLAHAASTAEYPAALVTLGGQVVARGVRAERLIAAEDFFVTHLTTSLRPEEILSEVRFPIPPAGSGWAFEEFNRRYGDFALAGVAALLVGEGRRCRRARLTAIAVGPTPIRLKAAEAILEQGRIDEATFEEAATRASEAVDPGSDLHATAEYRRHLTRLLTVRALRRAAARMQG